MDLISVGNPLFDRCVKTEFDPFFPLFYDLLKSNAQLKPQLKVSMTITANKYNSLILVLVTCCSVTLATGQEERKRKKQDPETVMLTTKDNVELRAEWFPGEPGKTTVPVILIHDWDGSRTDLYPLASYLHKEKGYAVLVPDLRGHGDSISRKNVDELIDRKKFRKNDFIGVLEDIDCCKRFLVAKNNQGEVNVDLLVIGVVGKMSPFAVDYTLRDWSWAPLGGIKQGQDVKAIVMISPEKKFKSASMTPAFRNPLINGKAAEPISIFMTWGSRNSLSSNEGDSIYSTLNRSRPEVSVKLSGDEKWKKMTLIRVLYNSKLSGGDLVSEQADRMPRAVGLFIDKKIAARKAEYRWQDRSRK